MIDPVTMSRRRFLTGSVMAGVGFSPGLRIPANSPEVDRAADPNKALIAITLDLEMSRKFPTPDQFHWDYEKGNLDGNTKKYTVEACRRAKAKGGLIHCFAVGRVFEQESVDWLKGIVEAGHPVGNHTYDHVNVKATQPDQIQFRFRRAPWLIRGKTPREVIEENIRLTNIALKTRIGIDSAGFRTPGGFSNGLSDRPDVQKMLLGLGYDWVSSKYAGFRGGKEGESKPPPEVFTSIVGSQEKSQPFVYESGLIEVPMSPISDVHAFRSRQWKLEHYLKAIRMAVEWAIEHRAVFDFLAHPSCLVVSDPDFRAVEMICELVRKAADRAAIVDLGTIARRARSSV